MDEFVPIVAAVGLEAVVHAGGLAAGVWLMQTAFAWSITLTPYMVLPLFATRFADYAGASESLS